MGCDSGCWEPVECKRCGKRKAPRGRSIPMEMYSALCNVDCKGYDQEPVPGHLWDAKDSDARYYDDLEPRNR